MTDGMTDGQTDERNDGQPKSNIAPLFQSWAIMIMVELLAYWVILHAFCHLLIFFIINIF